MHRFLIVLLLTVSHASLFADWHQGAGPNNDFRVAQAAPTAWSVVQNKNIAWTLTKPETGQSIPIVVKGKVFYSTMAAVTQDSTTGHHTVAWCVDAATGKVLWQRPIKAKHASKLSGCFGDNSGPTAVSDGERVIFLNSGGAIHCFDLDGNELWQKTDMIGISRGLSCLVNGNFIYTRQIYPPDENGRYGVKGTLPQDKWAQLEALDMKTGKEIWRSECGVGMGCAILPQKRNDGSNVFIVGRGGGHNPPEKPLGISMISGDTGKTIWTLELPKFASTQSYSIRDDKAYIFHNGDHLTIDVKTGKVTDRISITENISMCAWQENNYKTEAGTSIRRPGGRAITQTSNLLVGKYHFFRFYKGPYLGRVNVETGKVSYLELPTQLKRSEDQSVADELFWFKPAPPEKKGKKVKGQKKNKGPKVETAMFSPNLMKNSRGHVVMGDKRSKGSGWGHVASPTPSVAGDYLYLPVMNGTIYVIKWNAENLDENAIESINDLGPLGDCYTRSALSIDNGRIYTQTIKQLICIGK